MDILKKAGQWFQKESPSREVEEDDEIWTPPDAETARYRLMIQWANLARSNAEELAVPGTSEPTLAISKWVLGNLHSFVTEREREAHALPFGRWTQRHIINYSWSQQSGVIVSWALGLEPGLPGWDLGTRFDDRVWELRSLPYPKSWRPELQLRPMEELDAYATLFETCYWRLRCEPSDYVYKLLDRASQLGTITLAPDGDLATTDGRSVANLNVSELSLAKSLLSERLKACNWLAGQDEDWDMVTADTLVPWLWDENWKEPE